MNKLDTNADIFFLGANLTVFLMTSRTADVYPYDPPYKPLYRVPIVLGATTVMDSATCNLFIMVVKKAPFYCNKLDNAIINPNQLICYGTMVWDNIFDPNRGPYLDTCEWGTIYIIPEGTKIGFISHVKTEEELRNLPHIKVTSGLE